MKLHQFIVDIAGASRVLVATGGTPSFVLDIPVRAGEPDTAHEDEAVVVLLALTTDQAASTTQLLRAIPDGRTVIGLVPDPPAELSVAALIDVLVEGGIQAMHALPVVDRAFQTAVAGRRSSGTVVSVAPYLDVHRHIPLDEGPALLRVIAEHVVEGMVWRVKEAATRQELARLQRERDEARMLADAAHKAAQAAQQQVGALEDTYHRKEAAAQAKLADTQAELAGLQRRLRQILDSKSYRVARALSVPTRVVRLWSSAR